MDAQFRVLSTFRGFGDRDFSKDARRENVVYPVETISLNDLLFEHDAPQDVVYISVDAESAELSILKSFDFTKGSAKVCKL